MAKKYRGKFSAPNAPARRVPLVSKIMLILALVPLLTGAAAAYLSAATDGVINTFEAETAVKPTISETFDKKIKQNVSVNVGDPGYSVYVRAAVVVTWKNGEEGHALGQMPIAGIDYSLTLGDGWTRGSDGFYYYLTPVPSEKTGDLIEECKPLKEAPEEGYALNVEIITQTIQAKGTTDDGDIPAVQDAWKVDINQDGTLNVS